MDKREFTETIKRDPRLYEALQAAARTAPARGPGQLIADAAVITLMFPIARYILVNIGLPWLHEARRYSEIYRAKFAQWVTNQYANAGLDWKQVEAAGDALRNELERTSAPDLRKQWEDLAAMLKTEA